MLDGANVRWPQSATILVQSTNVCTYFIRMSDMSDDGYTLYVWQQIPPTEILSHSHIIGKAFPNL